MLLDKLKGFEVVGEATAHFREARFAVVRRYILVPHPQILSFLGESELSFLDNVVDIPEHDFLLPEHLLSLDDEPRALVQLLPSLLFRLVCYETLQNRVRNEFI